MKYSIVIPIYNESNNITKLSNLIKKYLKNKKYEVIFVDDNSKDQTQNELKKLKYTNFKFIIRKKKRDLSQSCVDGIKMSSFKNIVIMDGDLQHHPSCLLNMIKQYEKKKSDIIVGTRKFSNIEGLNFFRKFMSQFLILLISIFLKKKTSDPMSGFFIIKKNKFLKLEKSLYNKGFKILADIIYTDKNLKIEDVNINFKKRKKDKSKMNLIVLIHIIILIFQKKLKTFKAFQNKII